MRNHKFVDYLVLLAASICISGCPSKNKGASNSNGSSAPQSGILRYAITAEPTTFDPALVQDGPTIDLLQSIFEGLVQWNEKGELSPNLAEKWDISKDGLTYTFHLRKDIKFHNGRLMNAEDVKYSFERALEPDLKSTVSDTYLRGIKGAHEKFTRKASEVSGIQIIDALTIKFTLTAPRAYFLDELTYPTAFIVCKEEINKTAGKVTELSAGGTGPFKMKSYQQSVKVSLEAFADYHDGKPKLAGIERPIQKDANQRLSMYQRGDLDIVDLQGADLLAIKKDPNLSKEIQFFDRAANHHLAFNMSEAANFPPFKDVRVRQAFALALDKDAIITRALYGVDIRADGIVPPKVFGYNPNVKPLNFDPAKAKELLAAAGYPGAKGFPTLTLTFRESTPDRKNAAQVIQQQLQDNLGVHIELREMEWSTFLAQADSGVLPFYLTRWSADYLDAQDFQSVMLRTNAPQNHLGYSNPAFDALCDKADKITDQAKRLALYQKAEQIAIDEAPWVSLYYQRDVELIKPYVKGIRDMPLGHLPHLTTYFEGK